MHPMNVDIQMLLKLPFFFVVSRLKSYNTNCNCIFFHYYYLKRYKLEIIVRKKIIFLIDFIFGSIDDD